MKIWIDTRQQKGKHENIDGWLTAHGVEFEYRKLDFGDYMVDGSNISIDTKRNVAEIAGNIRRDHARFRRECERATDAGYRLIVLVENGNGYRSIDDVTKWTNNRCRPCKFRRDGICKPKNPRGKCARFKTVKLIQGPVLAKSMRTMTERYGVQFDFCAHAQTARKICDILGVPYDNDAR